MRKHAPCASRYAVRLAAAAGLVLQGTGCGNTDALVGALSLPEARTITSQSCPAAPAPEEAATLVVLDWDGGISPQVRVRKLAAFEVGALHLTDEAPDAGDLDILFREAVLERVQTILCALEPLDVAVIVGAADDYPGATVVHISGDAPFAGGKHIGQADFDPCNERSDNSVVIWGGSLATRIEGATFNEWVNAFANTTAHEIGHTLGFSHPGEESVGRLVPVPDAEVMRGNVTPSQLLAEQYFIIEQQTCPGGEEGDGSYRLVDSEDQAMGQP